MLGGLGKGAGFTPTFLFLSQSSAPPGRRSFLTLDMCVRAFSWPVLGLALQGDYLQLLLVEAPFPCQQILCVLPPIEQNVFACRQVPEKQQHKTNVALFHHAVEARKEGRKEGREERRKGGRKGGNVLFNDACNTFYLRLHGVRHMVKDHSNSERNGNILFNDALNTFYLRLHGIRHMVKDHSDNERKPAATTLATLSD